MKKLNTILTELKNLFEKRKKRNKYYWKRKYYKELARNNTLREDNIRMYKLLRKENKDGV